MVENFLRGYLRLMDNLNFRNFQNDLSQKVYDTLAQGYNTHSNEVALVGRMVEAINKENYSMLKFYADKIHGPRSYVEFNYRDKPTTKEIADMVILSVASYKRERVYQKITFIQNKVDSGKKWSIDDEQLFLLKNFPKFSGNKGIFKSFSNKEMVFLNHSRCLGSFGLFMNPGEMIFMSAPLLSELKNEKSITLDDIKVPETETNRGNQHFLSPFLFDHPFFDEMLHYMSKSLRRYAFSPFMAGGSFPFLNNSVFSRDIYDFIRNWSQFNIGEPTYAFGNVLNSDLDRFSSFLLRYIGLGEYVDLPDYNIEGKFHNEMAIFAMHIDLAQEI
jgi:hypothetical protein